MNYSFFIKSISLIGLLWSIAGCSNDDDPKAPVKYEVVDNLISSIHAINHYYMDNNPTYDVLYLGESSQCPINGTYVSIENYTTLFPIILQKRYFDNTTEYGCQIDECLIEANEKEREILKSDNYGRIAILFSGRGTYDFAIKIYNPTFNKYYITRPHRLTIWGHPYIDESYCTVSLIEE
ncbi:hypothetical protein [Bacteroides sp.]